MSDISRKVIEKSLKRKGFEEISGKGKSDDHKWYAFCHGKKKYPQITVKISRGSGYKSYGDKLLGLMKKRLELDKLGDVKDLLNCPMSKDDYLNFLIEKEIVQSSK